MPDKLIIRVEVKDARPVRPMKPFGVLLMELRSRLGLGGARQSKFRSSLSPSELREVSPPLNKRVRG